MWLLAHDGSLTSGKRLWLRPGTSHLLGRSNSATDFNIFVSSKSVSRKHLVIEVRPTTSSSPSELVLRDSSKFGTLLDGEHFVESERVVRPQAGGKKLWQIQLGKWDVAWRLEWHAVAVTVSGGKKAASLQERLEALDIAFVRDYVPGKVTHVVAAKRNTPKGLQALVEGRHLVSERFVEALEEVTAKREVVVNEDGTEVLPRAPLEEDFEGNWPKETDFCVPASGAELVERSVELYKPNPARASVFTGYTFIFCDAAQFEQLAPVVNLGSGKALLRELETGSEDVTGFVRYVKNVAGETGLGEFEDGSEGKGVVVVRISQSRAQDEEWYVRFCRAIDLELGQRSINQNEFLDAIVINDASALRQPLQPAAEDDAPPSSIPGPPPSSSVAPSQVPVPSRETQESQSQMRPFSTAKEDPLSSQPPVPNAARRGTRRAVTVSRFKGFDDFDPSKIPKTPHLSDDDEMQIAAPSQTEPTQASMANTQAQGTASRGKKRPHEEQVAIQISDDEDNKRAIDKLIPAAAAMKRRKLEQKVQVSAKAPESPPKPSLVLPSALRKIKDEDVEEIDVKQKVKERRQKEEEQRRKEEESFQQMEADAETMDVVPAVEEMEIRPRNGRAARADGENSDNEGWKPEWNGRKNFKKFRKRRSGEQDGESQAPIRSRRVIVPIEEAKTGKYSFKDSFWRLQEDEQRSGEDRDHISRRGRPNRIRNPDDTDVISVSDDNDDEDDDHAGPVSSIALRLDDDAEIHDLDPSEIAGVPRNQSIAALAKQAQAKLASSAKTSRPGTAGRHRHDSPPSQSQTLMGDSTTQQQRRGSSGSMASSTATTQTRTTRAGDKRRATSPPPEVIDVDEEEEVPSWRSGLRSKRTRTAEPNEIRPPKKKPEPQPKKKGKKTRNCGIEEGSGLQAPLGRGLGLGLGAGGKEDEGEDGLKFRRRR